MDYATAWHKAAREHKPLMIVFYADWCSPCQYMHSNVWNDQTVQRATTQYVVARVNIDREPGVWKQYQTHRGLLSIPAIIVVDVGKRVILRSRQGLVLAKDLAIWLTLGRRERTLECR